MSHFLFRRTSLALLLPLVSFSAVAEAAPAKKPAKKAPAKAAAKPAPKTAAKPAPKPTPKPVLGQNQMSGENGQFGTTYTLGKNTPLNFTLKSAEFTIEPAGLSDGDPIVPNKDQKLLILRFTVHNPLKTEQSFGWSSFEFTVVDALSNNHEYAQIVAREGDRKLLDIVLKPAQKIEAWTVVRVPATVIVPKLIVKRTDGSENGHVARYDLRGKVKALPAPYADATDTTGATIGPSVPAKASEFNPIGVYSARLEGASYTTEPLGENPPEAGQRFLTTTFTIKNSSPAEQRLYWGDLNVILRDSNGDKVLYNQYLLKATRDEAADVQLEAGEETRVRFFFALPEDVTGKTVALSETKFASDEARSFVFDLPNAE